MPDPRREVEEIERLIERLEALEKMCPPDWYVYAPRKWPSIRVRGTGEYVTEHVRAHNYAEMIAEMRNALPLLLARLRRVEGAMWRAAAAELRMLTTERLEPESIARHFDRRAHDAEGRG